MKLQIKEFGRLTGVSVRTLHYYDEIGLLKPSYVDEQNGYRFYDETSLERMQEILFYRELDFPLKSIAEILASPNYDKQKAIAGQKRLLRLKKDRLERLIAALEQAEKGEITMSAFDNSDYETARQQYEDEAKQRWGGTDAYKESQAKTAGYSKDKWNDVLAGMNGVFAEFAACEKCGCRADSETAQAWSKSCKTISRRIFITAPMTSSQGSVRCTSATSGSKTTSTATVKVLRNSLLKPSKSIARSNHKRHRRFRWRWLFHGLKTTPQ